MILIQPALTCQRRFTSHYHRRTAPEVGAAFRRSSFLSRSFRSSCCCTLCAARPTWMLVGSIHMPSEALLDTCSPSR